AAELAANRINLAAANCFFCFFALAKARTQIIDFAAMPLGRWQTKTRRMRAVSPATLPLRPSGAKIKPNEHFLGVGEIAYDAAQRKRKNFYHCGRSDDLLLLARLRVLINIDNFKGVAPGEVFRANPSHVLDCQDRPRRLAGHIKTLHILGGRRWG
ncbi:MAG TPA: hypothetical protein VKI40_04165, partial [Terriglobales bacterium]|nr:hypothetical protein [Terriglobales bacterium]